MNLKPSPPKKPFTSKIKRPSNFGRVYHTKNSEEDAFAKKNDIVQLISQNITQIDTTMNNLPKKKVCKKKETKTEELLPFIPMSH